MSDFVFSTRPKPKGELANHILSIYREDAPDVSEYHGQWGSLAVSRNLYNGFQAYENPEHITVVIGGPVLYFQDNYFLTGDNPVAGTQAIYRRWQSGAMRWNEDLSGPFVILIIDKKTGQISCITDLILFIPVYQFQYDGEVMLGTHVDALAQVAGQTEELDQVSLADFILHGAITYPYTAYNKVRQCNPAAMHVFRRDDQGIIISNEPSHYWFPEENNPFENLDQAAQALRQGLQEYVERVTAGMSHVAQFLSAGEDSRAVAGLLPQKLIRDAFVFLDSMNREGRLSKALAEAYEAKFHVEIRSKNHYLEILPEASDLIGCNQQYFHAHALGFHKVCGFSRYPAVFGGYLSDTFLKGYYIKTFRVPARLPGFPSFMVPGETRSKQVSHDLFIPEILEAITQRHRHHLYAVQQIRKETAHEWFRMWPHTMDESLPFFFSNRRLFPIYEPFMAMEVVKISAAVPASWKLNRRLFNKAMRPFLRQSRWLLHPEGHLPYFPWWFNIPIQCAVRFGRHIGRRIGTIEGNQGPWADFAQIIKGSQWQQSIELYAESFKYLSNLMTKDNLKQALDTNSLNTFQKYHLMATVYFLKKINDVRNSS